MRQYKDRELNQLLLETEELLSGLDLYQYETPAEKQQRESRERAEKEAFDGEKYEEAGIKELTQNLKENEIPEAEQKGQEEQQKIREEDRRRGEEQQRVEEKRKQVEAAEQKRQEEEKRKQAEAAERKRQEEEKRKQAEAAEQKRQEEEKRKQAEAAEQKRQEEEKRKQAEAAEQKRQEEEKRKQAEAQNKPQDEKQSEQKKRRMSAEQKRLNEKQQLERDLMLFEEQTKLEKEKKRVEKELHRFEEQTQLEKDKKLLDEHRTLEREVRRLEEQQQRLEEEQKHSALQKKIVETQQEEVKKKQDLRIELPPVKPRRKKSDFNNKHHSENEEIEEDFAFLEETQDADRDENNVAVQDSDSDENSVLAQESDSDESGVSDYYLNEVAVAFEEQKEEVSEEGRLEEQHIFEPEESDEEAESEKQDISGAEESDEEVEAEEQDIFGAEESNEEIESEEQDISGVEESDVEVESEERYNSGIDKLAEEAESEEQEEAVSEEPDESMEESAKEKRHTANWDVRVIPDEPETKQSDTVVLPNDSGEDRGDNQFVHEAEEKLGQKEESVVSQRVAEDQLRWKKQEENPEDDQTVLQESRQYSAIGSILFVIISFMYMESITHLGIYHAISTDIIYPLFFSAALGCLVYGIGSLCGEKGSRICVAIIQILFAVYCDLHLICHAVTGNYLHITRLESDIGGLASNEAFATGTQSVLLWLVLMLLPIIVRAVFFKKILAFPKLFWLSRVALLLGMAIFAVVGVVLLDLKGYENDSPYAAFYAYESGARTEQAGNQLGITAISVLELIEEIAR